MNGQLKPERAAYHFCSVDLDRTVFCAADPVQSFTSGGPLMTIVTASERTHLVSFSCETTVIFVRPLFFSANSS